MSDNKIAWIIGSIAIAALLVYVSNGSLFSASAPTTSTYDFQYDHKPTIFDAGAGKGYVQVYPADLHIGTEFTLPDNSAPIGSSYKLGNYIQVLRTQG